MGAEKTKDPRSAGGRRLSRARLAAAAVSTAALCALALPLAARAARGDVRVGHAPRLPRGARVTGALPSGRRLSAVVVLQPREPSALAAYATAVATPGSSVYHQYLTVSQFAEQFGPTPAQVAQVRSALRRRGLDPGLAAANRLSIPVSATAEALAHAFSTAFNSVLLPNRRRAYVNTSAPALPATVAGLVQGVIGLDSLARARPLGLRAAQRRPAAVRPHIVTGGPQPCKEAEESEAATKYGYTADELASAYEFSSLYREIPADLGAEQTVALFELEKFSSSNIEEYERCYEIEPTVNTTTVDSGPSKGTKESAETPLDIEDVAGLAPDATIDVYEGPNTNAGIYDTYNKIVEDDKATVVSTSWGECERHEGESAAAGENTLFQEAATQGQSVFAASGDEGSEDCAAGSETLAVDDPASQPYVTGVGGTTLSALGPPPRQSVWNGGCSSACGGGGGISTLWRMPSYQSGAPEGLNVINSNSSSSPCAAASGSGDCREVPDVTADANPSTGYVIYYKEPGPYSPWTAYGGTSAAAPLWAAFTALVDASESCKGAPVGFANPLLYALAGSHLGSYGSYFSDITEGSNDIGGIEGGLFPAGPFYDMASGLGSMVGSGLPGALCAQAAVKTIGEVAMPDASSVPTGITIDRANHVAYVDESAANAVAEIVHTNGSSFSGTATPFAEAGACPATSTECPLPGLDYPDGLAIDSAGNVYATNFCVGSQAGVCAGEPAGTTTAVSRQTGPSEGQADPLSGCSYASGDAVFTATSGASGLFVACAGSGIVAECSPSGSTPACGTESTSVAITEPSGGAGPPVPSGVADIPIAISSTPAVIVADARNATLSIVGLSGSTLTASEPTELAGGCEPAYLAVGPPSSGIAAVYVACPGNGTVEVGTVSSEEGTPTLGAFTAVSLPTTGTSTPRDFGIAINAAGTLLAVSDAANDDVVMYPAVSGTSLGPDGILSVGGLPDAVAIDEGNVFIANETSSSVSAVDPSLSYPEGHHVRSRRHGPVAWRTPLIAPDAPGRGRGRPPRR